MTQSNTSTGNRYLNPAVPVQVTAKQEYPHIVVRILGGVYQRENIVIHSGEPAVQVGFRSSYVRHPEPYTACGEISQGCRDLLVAGVIAAVQRTGFRMCLVWGRQSCTFCEKNGSTVESFEPPSGGFGSGGIGGTRLPIDIQFEQRATMALPEDVEGE